MPVVAPTVINQREINQKVVKLFVLNYKNGHM